jgi:hypothetical protein
MVDVPTIRYVRNGDVALAYQVLGDGPTDLVFLPSFLNNLEVMMDDLVVVLDADESRRTAVFGASRSRRRGSRFLF